MTAGIAAITGETFGAVRKMKVGTRKAIAVGTVPFIGVLYGIVLVTHYHDVKLMGMVRNLAGLLLLVSACLGAMVCAVMVGGWPYGAELAPGLGGQ